MNHDFAGVNSRLDEFAGFFSERLDALGEYLDRKHGKGGCA